MAKHSRSRHLQSGLFPLFTFVAGAALVGLWSAPPSLGQAGGEVCGGEVDETGLYVFQAGEALSACQLNHNLRALQQEVAAVADVAAASDGGLEFAGYTQQVKGYLNGTSSRSGLKAGDTLCDSAFPGSRTMTYEDYRRLGMNYTYEHVVWLPGGSYMADGMERTRDGRDARERTTETFDCGGFYNGNSAHFGTTLHTSGALELQRCDFSYALGCVYGS